ncbi:O-antigen/teichoic acid export membrane protein [Wenyingzhuangia heitensis]|uniref:O-antigen/teichoic acid export membrane protein n=1 Tax=Wenyingzhuangia heitensis TaxID=1487859 RepID=A0ABX0U967_9FLAO|nr:oligosaccharide flippase family protein [Wenyingzhuangia heitensis]NIJ44320.1 O-antigen/teichoic acid export membrane protein [Wenyingzhuangia heitensis]
MLKATKALHHIVGNITALFSLKVIDLGLSLWLIPYLIVKVGLYNYGVYAFAMSLVLFFENILNYGFHLSTVRELSKYKDNHNRVEQIVNQVISVKLFLVILLGVLFILLSFTIPEFSKHINLYLFSSLLLLSGFFSLRWFFMGIEKMKFITFIHLAATLIFVTLSLVYIKKATDYSKIPLYEAIGGVVTNIFSFVWVLKTQKIKIKLLSIKEIIKYLKLEFSSFINLLVPSTFGVFIVFLSGLLGMPFYVGLTQIGVKFTAAFTTLNTILTNVFYPLVNRKEIFKRATKKILIGSGSVLSLVMFVVGEYLIKCWLHFENGEMEENMIRIVKFLSPIPFLAAIVSSYGVNDLLTRYKDKQFGFITITTSLIMLTMAVILIPIYPIIGAALAFVIARFVYAILSYYFSTQIE